MATTTTESPLMRLPPELRTEIWRLVLVSPHPLTSYVFIHPIEEVNEETKAPMLVPGRSRIEAFPKVPPLLSVSWDIRYECLTVFWTENTFAINLGKAADSTSDTIHLCASHRWPCANHINMNLHFVLGRGWGQMPFVPVSLGIKWKPSKAHPPKPGRDKYWFESPADIILTAGGDLANQCICESEETAQFVGHGGFGVKAAAEDFKEAMPGLRPSYYPPTKTCEECGKPVVSKLGFGYSWKWTKDEPM